MNTIVILGAGFSYVADLPLAKDLFDSSVYVFSKGAEQRYERVWDVYANWRNTNPNLGAEQFLQYVYESLPMSSGVSWNWTVELVAATLASPRRDDIPAVRNRRYAGQLTKPIKNKIHNDFWDLIFRFTSVVSVLTFNYDILAERGIRHRQMVSRPRPGFFYGGFSRPQICLGNQSPFSVEKPERKVELTGRVPLYKLHGSLNWTMDGGSIVMFTDMRPAFRRGGESMIVPPVPEKITPAWLKSVWVGAEDALGTSERWIVCGYSLPSYDYAARSLFERSAQEGSLREIILLDPNSKDLKTVWCSICPTVTIIPLAGIFDSLLNLRDLLTASVS